MQIRPAGPDQPRRSRSAPQMRSAGTRQYFLSVPQIQSHISTTYPYRKSRSVLQVQISPQRQCFYPDPDPDYQSHISPTGTDLPRRLTSIFRQICNFVISPASLGLLTYYRSAQHFHFRIDPPRPAPQILPTLEFGILRLAAD